MFLGKTVRFPNWQTFYVSFVDVFVKKQNDFSTSALFPLIIDAGANIGMASIYFRYKYPLATIVAIEADRQMAKCALHNVDKSTIVIHRALGWKNRKVSFQVDREYTGGCVGSGDARVRMVTLNRICHEPIAYLKMDIEGAEERTLMDILKKYPSVIQRMFIEYHYGKTKKNDLGSILQLLAKRYHYKIEGGCTLPFVQKTEQYGVNIFAWERK